MYSQHTSKWRCPMNVETGALIFAIFNGLFTSSMSLASLMAVISFGSQLRGSSPVSRNYEEDATLVAASVMILTFAFISFGFSGILTKGILKKNSELVKIYFAYGVMVNILLVATYISMSLLTISLERCVGHDIVKIVKLVVLGIAFVYSLVLLMICCTYRKFERKEKFRQQFEHKMLVETKE